MALRAVSTGQMTAAAGISRSGPIMHKGAVSRIKVKEKDVARRVMCSQRRGPPVVDRLFLSTVLAARAAIQPKYFGHVDLH